MLCVEAVEVSWVKHKHLRTERLTVIGHARSQRRGARLLVASRYGGAGGARFSWRRPV